MVEELPEVTSVGPIKLDVGIPFYYEAWGIRYKLTKYGDWRIAQIVFGKKSDAESWMKEKYLRFEDMEGEVVPVVRGLLLTEGRNIKTCVAESKELCEKELGII